MRDRTNWSFKLYEIAENIFDTIPKYKIDQLPERYNEALLKKTVINEKIQSSFESSKLNLNQNVFVHHCFCLLFYSLLLERIRRYH